MAVKVELILRLDPADAALLNQLARTISTSKTNVLRWALRYYALAGPWPHPGSQARKTVVGSAPRFVVGPQHGALNND